VQWLLNIFTIGNFGFTSLVTYISCTAVQFLILIIFLSGAKIEYFTERMDPGLSFREKLEVRNHLSMDFFIYVLILIFLVELDLLRLVIC
jgi:hypothetical protein